LGESGSPASIRGVMQDREFIAAQARG